jgi:para-nitrobenzyl esterase
MRQICLLLGILTVGTLMLAAASGPEVTVPGGRIRGVATGDGGAAFKGIPYAKPPLGELRWRQPQPVTPWTGVRETTSFSPACTQLSEGWNSRYATGSTEDCLYLNVAAPEWPPKAKLPVMVWIHGGSNTAGSGETAGFDERTMPKRGIVLVTLNYRLGVLGFLSHPELARESKHETSGNYGLMDQLAALRWVKDNIAKFGGDPRSVTVAGQSAGGFDISLLMTSPLAKGLFSRAIAQSGAVSGFKGSITRARAEEIGLKTAELLKTPGKGALQFLRTVPAEELLKAAATARGSERVGLETSIDGYVLPQPPTEVFAKGKALPLPLITGNTAVETSGPNQAARLRATIQQSYGPLAERALVLYGLAGEGAGTTDPLYGGVGTQWSTDTGFRCPSTAQATGHANAGQVVYQYEFELPQPGRQATAHASELPYLFSTWPATTKLSPVDEEVSRRMQDYWVNFAKTGNPNGGGLPDWPRFTAAAQEYLAFTSNGVAKKSGLRRAFCEVFIESLKAQQAK